MSHERREIPHPLGGGQEMVAGRYPKLAPLNLLASCSPSEFGDPLLDRSLCFLLGSCMEERESWVITGLGRLGGRSPLS